MCETVRIWSARGGVMSTILLGSRIEGVDCGAEVCNVGEGWFTRFLSVRLEVVWENVQCCACVCRESVWGVSV